MSETVRIDLSRADAEALAAMLATRRTIIHADSTNRRFSVTDQLRAAFTLALAAAPDAPGEGLEALAERLRRMGWAIDAEGDDIVLRACRRFDEDGFVHRLYISNRNPLIPATVMFLEDGYDERCDEGEPVYTIGPTMTEETLDALILFRQFQKAAEANKAMQAAGAGEETR